MSFRLGKINSVEDALRIRIPDRRPLSGHIGKEHKAIAPSADQSRGLVHLIQRAASKLLFEHPFLSAELFLKPAHRSAAAGCSALKEPSVRHHMVSQNQPRIRMVLIHADAHASGLSALFLGFPGLIHADSQRSAARVQSARHNARPFQKTGFFRSLRRHMSDDRVTGSDIRQKALRYSQLSRHLLIPAPFSHVKAVPAVTLGKILCYGTGQAVHDKPVALQNLVDPAVQLRHRSLIPDHLGSCVHRLKRVPRNTKDPLRPNLRGYLTADVIRPGVHPDRSRAQNPALLVHGHRGPALPVHADCGNLLFRDAGLFKKVPDRRRDPFPPVVRVLLRPPRVGIIHGIILRHRRCHMSVFVEYGSLAGAGTDINSQKQFSHDRSIHT